MTVSPFKRIDHLKLASSLSDLALLLGFQPKPFAWVVYKQPSKYTSFTVPKKRGGHRLIKAPEPKLKNVQKRLCELLQDCIADINNQRGQTEKLSHGFRRKHSIMSNAYQHRGRRYVLNIDLKDFFDTINFGRVRGFFMTNKHFALHERTATAIAQIACHDNSLPQGAPTSPVVSNLIAHILDVRLAKLSRRYGVHYTRYADDLTFSTNRRAFPEQIAKCDATGTWVVGEALEGAIERAGFLLNPSKTRMQFRQSRQDVTGLVVNDKINVRTEYYRDARAKCHSLFRTGKFFTKSQVRKDDGSIETKDIPGEIEQLFGQMSFIDSVKRYQKIFDPDYQLSGQEKVYRNLLFYRHCYASTLPTIFCEGKTDNVYLRCAILALAADFDRLAEVKDGTVDFKVKLFNYNEHSKRLIGVAGGSGQLHSFITDYRKNMKPFSAPVTRQPVILLVDNDSGADGIFKCVKSITKNACDGKENFYFVTDNLYVVPTPLTMDGNQTMIEDFLPLKWRDEKLGGKVLNLGKNLNTEREYGKSLFAEHVIKKNRKDVDFDGFRPILDRIVMVMDDFANRNSPTLT
ncbi:retron Ec67 family RNA-directed DNA polymerase/endonuclease [Sphingopyxis sp. USTB-05]|uniref:retron Ec67 family RNA-directed DNA polymerase/endonuclease n=1 Tax=Sphingopyxis sp. USTB-05 TaxID=2830667 RepID=UPI0020786E4E|nr:retron Ec67 family RNA-directed DNA polymerase/endonuclease [Sphingopyxis sp. USTB-05]USI75368.1 retron Ec67 family RNA-directed DNA polymerase/endonuclease [Sphingopyxis sp. USTB-05]